MTRTHKQSREQLLATVQVNIRMNRSLLKVLKATAEYLDMPFSGLMESIAVNALDGACLFGPDLMKPIQQFKKIYGMDAMLDALAEAAEGHGLEDEEEPGAGPNRRPGS
jgi:hypothetical protein